MFANPHVSSEHLSTYSRGIRALLGAALILITLTTDVSPLGYISLLPLVAIYLVFNAISGWCALAFLYHFEAKRQTATLSPGRRILLSATGGALIASVYFTSGTLGYFSILPLLGIVPVYVAIIGLDPIAALCRATYTADIETVNTGKFQPQLETKAQTPLERKPLDIAA